MLVVVTVLAIAAVIVVALVIAAPGIAVRALGIVPDLEGSTTVQETRVVIVSVIAVSAAARAVVAASAVAREVSVAPVHDKAAAADLPAWEDSVVVAVAAAVAVVVAAAALAVVAVAEAGVVVVAVEEGGKRL